MSEFYLSVFGLSELYLSVFGFSEFYLSVFGLSEFYLSVFGLSELYLSVFGFSDRFDFLFGKSSEPGFPLADGSQSASASALPLYFRFFFPPEEKHVQSREPTRRHFIHKINSIHERFPSVICILDLNLERLHLTSNLTDLLCWLENFSL